MTTKQRLGVEPIKKEGPLRPPRFDAFMPPCKELHRSSLTNGPVRYAYISPLRRGAGGGQGSKESGLAKSCCQLQKAAAFVESLIDWCLLNLYAVFWRLP